MHDGAVNTETGRTYHVALVNRGAQCGANGLAFQDVNGVHIPTGPDRSRESVTHYAVLPVYWIAGPVRGTSTRGGHVQWRSGMPLRSASDFAS